ncbi:MAG TPA: MBL fold metallo-hydrolase [Gemmatimonadales bacterium]|jgi:phosphoribosyl 1,2-cyclic phosphodiesterase
MHLTVLGSGSKGNAFALQSGGAILLIDAGFSPREIERRMEAAGLAPAAIAGIAVTHEHGDHAMGTVKLAARHDVPVLTSLGTWTALRRSGESCDFIPLGTAATATVGPFAVSACPTSHDAAEPIAIGVIADGVSIGAAYDLGRPTQAVRWFLRDRHCLILEANHDETMLRTSGYPIVVQQRIAGPGGHLSNADAARLLDEIHHEELAVVVLAHVSQRCNSDGALRAVIEPALAARGYRGDIIVAVQDGPMTALRIIGPAQRTLFA